MITIRIKTLIILVMVLTLPYAYFYFKDSQIEAPQMTKNEEEEAFEIPAKSVTNENGVPTFRSNGSKELRSKSLKVLQKRALEKVDRIKVSDAYDPNKVREMVKDAIQYKSEDNQRIKAIENLENQ